LRGWLISPEYGVRGQLNAAEDVPPESVEQLGESFRLGLLRPEVPEQRSAQQSVFSRQFLEDLGALEYLDLKRIDQSSFDGRQGADFRGDGFDGRIRMDWETDLLVRVHYCTVTSTSC